MENNYVVEIGAIYERKHVFAKKVPVFCEICMIEEAMLKIENKKFPFDEVPLCEKCYEQYDLNTIMGKIED